MTPGSFDAETARAMVGDMRARTIEASAREHAEVADLENPGESYAPPSPEGGTTYWDAAQHDFARAVYHAAFQKRIERRRRKDERAATEFNQQGA